MRDQHRIDAAQRAGVDLGRPAEVGDAVPEQRVGEEPDAAEIDEDGGVPDVLDGGAAADRSHRDPTSRARPGSSGSGSIFCARVADCHVQTSGSPCARARAP